MSLDFTALHFHIAYPVLAGFLGLATAWMRGAHRRNEPPRQIAKSE